jgi:hypothetical protein
MERGDFLFKIVPIILVLLCGLFFDGCFVLESNMKAKENMTMERKVVETTTQKTLDYTTNYKAVEYPTDKYETAPVIRINQYNDGSAIISMDIGTTKGVFGTCHYGAMGQVTLYTGSESMKTTFARAEISSMDNRMSILFCYPMGECETIVFEKVIK